MAALLRVVRREASVSDRGGRFLAFAGPGAYLFQEILQWRKVVCWVLMKSLTTPSAIGLGLLMGVVISKLIGRCRVI